MSKQPVSPLGQVHFYGLMAMILFIPIVFLTTVNDIFILPKAISFQLATLILLGIWLTNLVISPQVVIKRGRFDLLAFAFLAVVIVSTIFSVHPPTSIFGAYDQYEGLITFTSYFVVYFLASQIDWEINKLHTLLNWLVATAVLISIYGLIQYFGFDFVRWPSNQFELNRSFSTFGNPSFLAGYLALALFPSLSLFLSSSGNKQLLYGGSSLLISGCIITTFTRGGWIATLIGLAIFSGLSYKWAVRRFSKVIIFGLLIILLISLVVFWTGQSVNPVTNPIKRWKSIFNLNQSGVRLRFSFWQVGWKIFKAKPILGSGPDTFSLEAAKYQTRLMGKYNALPRNAHNYLIQLLATLGIVGLFLFVVIVVLFFIRTKDLIDKIYNRSQLIWVGIVSGLTSYFISILVEVNVVQIMFIGWIFFGIAATYPDNDFNSNRKWLVYKWDNLIGLRITIMAAYLVLAFILTPNIIRPLVADMNYLSGYRSSSPLVAANQYKQAATNNPYVAKYWLAWARIYKEDFRRYKEITSLNTALGILKQAKAYNPLEPKYYFFEGTLYYLASQQFTNYSNYYQSQAINSLNQAIDKQPSMFSAHFMLANIYLESHQYRQAKKELAISLAINPTSASAWAAQGYLFEVKNKPDLAIHSYRQALKLKPGWKEAAQSLRKVINQQKKKR